MYTYTQTYQGHIPPLPGVLDPAPGLEEARGLGHNNNSTANIYTYTPNI